VNYDLRDRDLSTVLAEASLLADETKAVFGRLSGEQLNWRPSESEWSVGQCFDHLIIANRAYVPLFEDILAGRRPRRVWERVPLLPRVFGTLLINTLRPDSGRRAKAPRALHPSRSSIAPEIIATFLEQQDRLRSLMEASGRLDLARITITSPVLRFVTYSLLDACRIIVVHEQNHFVQALRVVASPGFPR
jgi:DinB family protein